MGIEDLRRALDDSARAFGEDDIRTLSAHRELADAYLQAREYVESFAHQERVVAGAVRLLGADHRTTVSALGNLAHVWFSGWLADGRPELAAQLYELAVAERIRIIGPDDPGTLSARNDLGTAYFSSGQPQRALAVFEQAHLDCVRVLGEDHSLARLLRDNFRALAGIRDTLEADRDRDRDRDRPSGGAQDRAQDRTQDRPRDNRSKAQEIAAALSDVLGLEPAVAAGRVSVVLPAIGETLGVPVHDVKRITRSHTPMGDPALEFVMLDGGDDVRPLIVLADDVLFAPEDPAAVLQSRIPVTISDAPTLISYRDMVRQAERFALTAAAPGAWGSSGGGTVTGTCLLSRCVIAGAVRCGLHSLPAVAWWQKGWQALGGEWDLPPFPKDPVWDHLVRSAAGLRLTPSAVEARADQRSAVLALTVRDFAVLRDRLTVVQPDEEFVATWQRLVPVTPGRFADLLMERLVGARADVALYPDGAGSVELVIRDGEAVRALLQLRFDFRTRDMSLDEVRITEEARGQGLFQRLEYNTEQLALALGMRGVRVLATDIGVFAFSKAGFPRDPELYAKAHGDGPGRAVRG